MGHCDLNLCRSFGDQIFLAILLHLCSFSEMAKIKKVRPHLPSFPEWYPAVLEEGGEYTWWGGGYGSVEAPL